MNWIANWQRRLPLMFIALAAIAGVLLLKDHISYDALFAHRSALLAFRDSHYLLASLGFVAAYILLVAFSVPGAIWATLTGGFLFGLFPGVIFNVIGATFGAILVFLAARAGIGAEVDAKIKASGGFAARMQRALAENEVSALLTMRLVPGMPFFLVNLIPAFVGTTLRRFAWTTALGLIPGALVFTSVGAGLEHVFAQGGRPDLGIIFSPPILLPLLALAALSMLPTVYRYLRNRGLV
jgi:uncharacterized membrane protein YdjX (TVP38/TMEM64 family)